MNPDLVINHVVKHLFEQTIVVVGLFILPIIKVNPMIYFDEV